MSENQEGIYAEPFPVIIIDNEDGNFEENDKSFVGKIIYVEEYLEGTIQHMYLDHYYHIHDCVHNDEVFKNHSGYNMGVRYMPKRYAQPIPEGKVTNKDVAKKLLRKDL